MKTFIALFLIISIVCLIGSTDISNEPVRNIFDSSHITIWGKQSTGSYASRDIIDIIAPPDHSLEEILRFPEQQRDGVRTIIHGVSQMDFNTAHPSNVTIIGGGIGQSFVKLSIIAAPGMEICSSFSFYYKEYKTSTATMNVNDFIETNFEIDG